jgi:hypothetical protein
VINENNINLKIHTFPHENENLLFCPVKSREELEKSGIKKLYETLIKEYDSIQYSVSTNLSHKLVYEISNQKKKKIIIIKIKIKIKIKCKYK